MQSPKMTVLMCIDQQRERGARALQSLLEQNGIDEIEVLLLDNRIGNDAPLPGSDHSSVRVLPMPNVKSFGEAMVYGFEEAHAPIVALIEEHCVAFPGWAEALIQAHQGPYVAISGEIHNFNPGQGASDFVFCIYFDLIAPRRRGETKLMIGHNTSFKREILLKYDRDELIDLMQSEVLLKERLLQDGYKFFAEPAAKFLHANESIASSHFVGLFLSNRIFGATRVRVYQWTFFKRLFYVLIAPVAPFIRLMRDVPKLREQRPGQLSISLHTLFTLWLFHATAVIGQAVGLIWGEGDSGRRFLMFEMNEYRLPSDRKLFMRIP